jgi:hypothetical protein
MLRFYRDVPNFKTGEAEEVSNVYPEKYRWDC